MRIRRLRFTGHPILGNLDLDIVDPVTGSAAAVVVIAGENGSGKTLVLNEIYRSIGDVNLDDVRGIIEIFLEVSTHELDKWRPFLFKQPGAPRIEEWDRVIYLRFTPSPGSGWSCYEIWPEVNGTQWPFPGHTIFDYIDRRPIKVFFSETEISFQPSQVGNIGVSQIDRDIPARRSGSGLAQEIAQLLVDIRAADNEDIAQWIEDNPNKAPGPEIVGQRMQKFTSAIEYMFQSKKFKNINRKAGTLSVDFIENGNISSLETLSTGEKQIVFRGGFILRDIDKIQDAIILIDEPELGLHPDWQARIVGFYTRLFPGLDTGRTQLIFTTHSPFIVHDQVQANVIILRKSKAGGSDVDPSPLYPTTGQARVVKALNIPAIVARASHDTIVLVEGDTDVKIILSAWQKLRQTQPPMDVKPALSDTAIRVTLKDDQLFHKNPGKKIVGLFDFDRAWNDWNGTWPKAPLLITRESEGIVKRMPGLPGWAMLLPVPATRSFLASMQLKDGSALSVELMFEDQYHIPGMIDYKQLPAVGATVPVMKKSMKSAFAVHAEGLPQAAFIAFEPLLQRLEDILSGRL